MRRSPLSFSRQPKVLAIADQYASCAVLCFAALSPLSRLTVEPAKGGAAETLEADVVLVSTGGQAA